VHEPFTLLVSVYDGDRPDYIQRALRSAVDDQTVPPDQVVIVRDGPVRAELADCLADLTATCQVPVTFVPLERNGGLGPALDRGLAASWHDVIARMDADDVAMPQRFEVQLPLMADADIVGSGLLEFVGDTDDVVGQRVPPLEPGQIARYARVHDPFNHPTVVYRRSAVLAAGGYGDLPLMEDYALFARMLQSGARARNVTEPLVFYRVGATAFKRRGGTGLLRSELRLQREFLRTGFTSRAEFARNVLVRGGYRLVPWQVRRAVYRVLVSALSKRTARQAIEPLQPGLPDWEYTSEWQSTDLLAAGMADEPAVPASVPAGSASRKPVPAPRPEPAAPRQPVAGEPAPAQLVHDQPVSDQLAHGELVPDQLVPDQLVSGQQVEITPWRR
jgi:glycosyltransferase involved in cell wall biosynthesis